MNRIFTIIICFIFISFLQTTLMGRDPKWFENRMGDLNRAIQIPNNNERIAALGDFLDIGTVRNMDEEQKSIFYKAQAELLAIPGHAKYYQDKIEEMRKKVLIDSKRTPQELEKMQNEGQEIMWESTYEHFREISLRTLQFMPSAETVSVLGHFLDDPEGKDGKNVIGRLIENGQDYAPRPRNAEQAAKSIRKLGIEHPPFQEPGPNPHDGLFEGEVDAWQSWWSQIRDGKRTYRFIGSKIEYGADGPASKEVVQRAERDRKRDEEREVGHKKSAIAPETGSTAAVAAKPLSIAGILAACALIGGAVWYYLRGRKAA
ncbi:MAG: hypothetical protein ABIT37_06880 [Luteolibacter sp.]